MLQWGAACTPPCPPTFCSLLRMLRAHLGADKPVETEPSCPEDGGAGPHPDTAVGRSPEDGRAEDMLVSGAQAQGCRPGGCGPRGYRRGHEKYMTQETI